MGFLDKLGQMLKAHPDTYLPAANLLERFDPVDGKELEEKARIIAGQTLKEALHGITLEELSIGQEVLKKVFFNTKD